MYLRALFALPLLTTLAVAAERVDGHGDPLPSGACLRLGTTRLRAAAEVGSAAFAPDGKRAVSVTSRIHYPGEVCIWDVATGKAIRRLESEFQGTPETALFSPDGKLLATGGSTGYLRLYDAASGDCIRKIALEQISALTFSPDGSLLASADYKGFIRLWAVSTGQEARALTGHKGNVTALVYGFGGRNSGVIQVRDLVADKEMRRLVRPDIPTAMRILRRGCTALAFTAESKALLSANFHDPLCLWDLTANKEPRILLANKPRTIMGLAYSPDGRTVATSGFDRDISLCELASGKERYCWPQQPGSRANTVAYSHDSRYLASGSNDLTVCLWHLVTGEQVWQSEKGSGGVACVAFSPDDRLLAAADHGGVVRVLEASTGRVLRQLKGHRGIAYAVAFSPDGKRLASASADTTVLVWDIAGLARTATAPSRRAPAARSASLSVEQLEQCFRDLADEDAACAYRALRALAAAPDAAVPFLRKQLQAVPLLDPRRLARWIADLDSDQFPVRQEAVRRLEEHYELAETALRRTLREQPSLEARRRIEELIERMVNKPISPDMLRSLRAIEVLETIGSRAAGEVLASLSEGAPEARQTREAKAALRRQAEPR